MFMKGKGYSYGGVFFSVFLRGFFVSRGGKGSFLCMHGYGEVFMILRGMGWDGEKGVGVD